MSVEEIRVRATAPDVIGLYPVGQYVMQQFPVHLVGVVAVPQPRPQVNPPAFRPARRFIAFDLQRFAARLCQFGRAVRPDVVAGIQPEQMRLMPVFGINVFPVVIPFLQITGRSNLLRIQAGQCLLESSPKIGVYVQYFGGFDGLDEALANHSQVGGSSVQR